MSHNILQTKLNNDCSMKKYDKHNLGKRFSKFLLKICGHLSQPVPNYSTINGRHTTSIDKRVLNSNHHHQQQSVGDTDHNQISYPTRYRRCSILQRTPTLMSIQEENEIELMNCK